MHVTQIMIENDFRHLPVVQPNIVTPTVVETSCSSSFTSTASNNGEFIGVVSMRDVVRELVQQKKAENAYLQDQIDKLANAVGGVSVP